MDKVLKSIVAMFTMLLVAGSAWALPISGGQVKLEADYSLPYTLTDLNDSQSYSTFCLESKNYFTPGHTYYVTSVGDYAEGGGLGAVDGKDLVEEETKWLYAAYMSGVFNSVTNSAQRVQNAIWWLESESGGQKGDWLTLSGYAFDASGWKVVAVNLSYTQDGMTDNQSQLVGVAPVPEPATMLLLGTGLLGLAGLGRKKMKRS